MCNHADCNTPAAPPDSGDRVDPLVGLPVYDSNATPEEKKEKAAFFREQIKYLSTTPEAQVKLTCGCGRRATWMYMYRCLYCGIFFCRECAQLHFGYRLPDPNR